METKTVQVVVIGAGLAGLVAVKSCLEENLQVICFEKSNSVGGTFDYKPEGFSCSKTTTLNVSKELMAFSDFPFPDETPNFVINFQYLEYLKSYADHFHLNPCIKLQQEVVSVEAGPQFDSIGNWKITVKDIQSGALKIIITNNVMMCTGLFNTPHFETFPGLDSFQGQVCHASTYKTSQGFEGKNVLVIGNGNWAYDIAVEVGNVAKKVNCITKEGLLVISRMGPNGYPFDISFINRFRYLKWTYWDATDAFANDLKKSCTPDVDLEAYGLPLTNYKADAHIICINDQLPYSILTGRVEMHSPIERFTPNGVIFQGKSTEYPLDVVVMATGYETPELTLFPHRDLTRQDYFTGLFKRIFPVKLQHQTVAFICAGRFNNSTALHSELHSRLAAAVFSGRVALPSKMSQKAENNADNRHFSGRLPVILAMPYFDRVAQLAGVKPNFVRMFFTDPKLFRALMFGPVVGYQFRLEGPHSWSKARETILTVPDRVRAGFGSRPIIRKNKPTDHFWKLVKYILSISIFAPVIYHFYQNKLYNLI